MFVIKKPSTNDAEIPKLIKREYENYMNFYHPLLPKFIGKTEKEGYNAIEFIYGQTLLNIKNKNLNDNEKITIIFQLILILDYLHYNHFIFRDLKPNNVMIDQHKNIVLVDFDRMVKNDYVLGNQNDKSNDLSSIFIAPEVNYQVFSYECDVYSIGMMIYYIMMEGSLTNKLLEYPEMDRFYNICIKKNPEERPKISDLLVEFYLNFHSQIQIDDKLNHFYKTDAIGKIENINKMIKEYNGSAHYIIGKIYYQGDIVKKDIEKALYYLKSASLLNDSEAQFTLALIYYSGYVCKIDINLAIKYFTMSANQNHRDALFFLGLIYYEGKYVKQNINKAMDLFIQLANQKSPESQYKLGMIYFEGIYAEKNINKAIHYLSLAANQNYKDALKILAHIYGAGKLVPIDLNRVINYLSNDVFKNDSFINYNVAFIYKNSLKNIKKAIHYYTIAANLNHLNSMYELGMIYQYGKFFDKDINKDINKAIHYYTLAADQNHEHAQLRLGVIYQNEIKNIYKAIHYYQLAANQNNVYAFFYLGQIYHLPYDVPKNINKAIYFYSKAANLNDSESQFRLGYIYENEIKVDINKAIYYYTLAANQGHKEAQLYLGGIFANSPYIKNDINRSIYYYTHCSDDPVAQINLALLYYNDAKYIDKTLHYLSLASKNNYSEANFILGGIFFDGIQVSRDINKAIYYFQLAANQNHANAQFMLGQLYYSKEYSHFDINKAIFYLELSAKQYNMNALFKLGYIFLEGKYVQKDIKKALYYLDKTLYGRNPKTFFIFGFLYQEGKYVDRDLKKSIRFYKEASSYNNQYAKNNLGVMYLNGIGVDKNVYAAIEYFEEAIRQNNDNPSVCNLIILLTYEEINDTDFNKLFLFVIKSLDNDLPGMKELLSFLVIKKIGLDYEIIKKELDLRIDNSNDILSFIFMTVEEYGLTNQKKRDYYLGTPYGYMVYNCLNKPIKLSKLELENSAVVPTKKVNITDHFYEGFGF